MGLAVALDLRHLRDGFPVGPQGGVGRCHGRTVESRLAERPALAQVAVVRNRDDAAARAGLVIGEVDPQVLGVGAVISGEGQRLPGLLGIPGKQDVAMQVRRRVFVPDEGSERAGIVVAFGSLDDGMPNLASEGVVDAVVAAPCRLPRHHRLGQDIEGAGILGVHDLGGGRNFREEPGPRLAVFRCQQTLVAAHEPWKDPDILGVVGDHQEVQWAVQPSPLAPRRDDFLALGEPVGLFGRGSRAQPEGIGGEVGVHMGVTPVHGIGIGIADGRRIGVFGDDGRDESQAAGDRHGVHGRAVRRHAPGS